MIRSSILALSLLVLVGCGRPAKVAPADRIPHFDEHASGTWWNGEGPLPACPAKCICEATTGTPIVLACANDDGPGPMQGQWMAER